MAHMVGVAVISVVVPMLLFRVLPARHGLVAETDALRR